MNTLNRFTWSVAMRALALSGMLFAAGCLEPEDANIDLNKEGQLAKPQDLSLVALQMLEQAQRSTNLRPPPPATDANTADLPPPPEGMQHVTGETKRPPPHLLACDEDPEITTVDVCGRPMITNVHLEWTDCKMPPPHMHEGGPRSETGETDRPKPEGDGPPDEGARPVTDVTSTGTLDITADITVDPVDACTDGTVVTVNRTAELSETRTSSRGTATGKATLTSDRSHTLGVTGGTDQTVVEITSQMNKADGKSVSLALTGTLDTTFAQDGTRPTAIANGTLKLTADSKDYTLVIEGINRTRCPWPTEGTIKRTDPDAKTHVLTFGPDCGAATLDGTVLDLKKQGPEGGKKKGGMPPKGERPSR